MKENGKKCWRQLFFTRNTLSQNPRQALKGQQWETKETSQREKYDQKEIVQRKENTHGEIRTPLVRGVSSQRLRCCGMVGSVKLLTLKQSSLPYALFEACGAVFIMNSNVHLRTNGFNDNFGVMLYYFSVNPIDVWSWAETEQSLMWSIGHIDRRGKNQFTVGFPQCNTNSKV